MTAAAAAAAKTEALAASRGAASRSTVGRNGRQGVQNPRGKVKRPMSFPALYGGLSHSRPARAIGGFPLGQGAMAQWLRSCMGVE